MLSGQITPKSPILAYIAFFLKFLENLPLGCAVSSLFPSPPLCASMDSFFFDILHFQFTNHQMSSTSVLQKLASPLHDVLFANAEIGILVLLIMTSHFVNEK
jgi:hypothetical protein